MMFALDGRSRALCACAAFAAFAGAFVTAPFAARGASGFDGSALPRAAVTASAAPFAVVLPRRDPFAGESSAAPSQATGNADTGTARTPVSTPAVPPFPQIPAAIQALPPNAGASGTVPPFPAAARVTAVITGAHPFALVDEAGTTRLVTLGDRVGGNAVTAIGSGGVRLADGSTLPLAPQAPSPPRAVTSFSGGLRP